MTSVSQAEQADIHTEEGLQALQQPVGSSGSSPVTYISLLLFYLPLGFSGLMMTLDLPIVNAVLNRFPNPDTSVAALRVAFSLALVYEASHICMIDLSTALSTDQRTFRLLQHFYIVVAGVLLVIASAIAFSPVYDLIVRNVMNIPPAVAEAARPAIWAFLLWPVPIGWRRLCQGALIRHGHPKPVGAGGIVRLAALAVALVFFGWLGTNVFRLEPTAIAVLAMLVSVTAESLAVQGWTTRVLRTMPEDTPGKAAPTFRDLWHFFFPLSGTAIMSTLVQPVLTAGIASAAVAWASPNGSVVAVASYAVAWSVAFLVFGPTLSMTQASIAWHGSDNPQVRERGPRVILGVGVALGLLMVLAALSGFARWLFTTVIQAPPETAAMAVDVTYWLIPMPILHAASFMLRGKLIALHEPRIVRRSQFIDLVFLMLLVGSATTPFVASLLHGVPAAPLAAVAYNLMLVVDITVLYTSLRQKRSIDEDPRHKEHI
jgi:Na+-driven multidrug efflux pump